MQHRLNNRFPGEPGTSRTDQTASVEQRHLLREHARQIRFSRDLRGKMFNRNIFGEPAWDILLTLYTIDGDRRRLNTRELSKLANLALTTALRWLDYLEQQELIDRKPHPFDLRMIDVELSDKGRAAIDDYLLQMRRAGMFGSIAGGKD